jgi:hypothetical protein
LTSVLAKDVEVTSIDAMRLTQRGDIVAIAVEALSEIIEDTREVCDLRFLRLSITVEYRIAEIDIAGR